MQFGGLAESSHEPMQRWSRRERVPTSNVHYSTEQCWTVVVGADTHVVPVKRKLGNRLRELGQYRQRARCSVPCQRGPNVLHNTILYSLPHYNTMIITSVLETIRKSAACQSPNCIRKTKNTFCVTWVYVSLSKFCKKNYFLVQKFHWNRAIGCRVKAKTMACEYIYSLLSAKD